MLAAEKSIRDAVHNRAERLIQRLLRARQEGNTHCDGELRVSLADDRIVSGAVTIVEKFKA